MSKKIELQGLTEFIADWQKATIEVDKNKKKLESLLMILIDINNEFKKNSGLKNFIKTQEKTERINKKVVDSTDGLTASQKKLQQATKALEIAQSKEASQIQEVRVKTLELNKANKLSAQQSLGLVGAYKKLSLELIKNREAAKNAAVQYGVNSKEFKKLSKEVSITDKKLKSIDSTLGQSQRHVGNYGKALGLIGKNLIGSLGITFGLTAFASVLKSSFDTIKGFNKQQAVLAGVLGKSRNEIKALTEDAKRLGSTTAFTASEVSNLQESYARLGFSQQQILDSTEATLNGALALQSDLGATAELVGSTLNQFKLDAVDSSKVVDILSKSTQISALNFEKLRTALPIVGKTAQVAGVSLERTAGLLGVLSSNGIDASTAATGLRNIFLDVSKKGISFEDALEKINKSTNKNSTAMALFGKRGATVAVTLAENTKLSSKFTKQLDNSAGAAQKLADEQLDTLDGSLKLLTSAWEGLILSIEDGTGALGLAIRGVVKFATSVLEFFTPAKDKAGELSQEFFKQKEAVSDLEKNVNPLLDRYDELQEKTSLNIDEQEELDSLILQLAKDIPSAITEFDEYGKALGINTIAARGFVKQQKQILLLKNAEAIEAQVAALKKVNEEIGFTKNTLNGATGGYRDLVVVNGELFKKVIAGGKLSRVELEKVEGGIVEFQKKLQDLQNERLAREGILAGLRGEKTKEQLAAEKAALDLANKEKEDADKELTESEIKNLEKLKKIRARDAHALRLFRLEQEAKVQEELLENENENSLKRIAAAVNLEHIRKEILEASTEFQVKDLKDGSAKKILIEEKAAVERLKIEQDLREKVNKIPLSTADLGDLEEIENEAENEQFEKELQAFIEAEKKKQKAVLQSKQILQDAFASLSEQLGISASSVENIFKLIDGGFETSAEKVQAYGNIANSVFSAITSASNANIEQRINANERERDAALDNASLTEAQRSFLEEQFDQKKAKLQKKQAENDKKQAIISTLINTGVAVVKALPNIPLSIAVGALGLVQTGLIASRKIPEFAVGTDDAPEGIARVGEKGAELITDKKGKVKGVAKYDSYTYLSKGDKVFTASQTKDLLGNTFGFDNITSSIALNGLKSHAPKTEVVVNGISKADMMDVMKTTLAQQPKRTTTIDRFGIKDYYTKGSTTTNRRDIH